MENNHIMFLAGIGIGIFIFGGILILTKTSPVAIERRIHTEAVERGHGKWIINTNRFDGSTPTTSFEWNK